MRILGIETSCDDTGVCLIEAAGDFGFASAKHGAKAGCAFSFKILGNALSSQTALGEQYGGVFPAMAKREHAKNLVPALAMCLRDAKALEEKYGDISLYLPQLKKTLEREPELLAQLVPFLERHERPDIDALAVTYGPGLEPCLWVGINFARALSAAWNVPLVAVNHMEGHIVMSMMNVKGSQERSNILQNVRTFGTLAEFEYPILALLISGGNTQLVLSKEPLQYEVVGKTRDDAVGEAFDKVARMLELPYPGGPHISRLALEARSSKLEADFKLPRPMLNEDHFDFSFSGLKTAVLRLVENKTISDDTKKRVAREFEDTVTDVLVGKTLRAVEEYGANAVVMGGGVSANKHTRLCLAEALAEAGAKLLVCPPEFSTDNAVMIALAGYFHARKYEFTDPETLTANGSLKLG